MINGICVKSCPTNNLIDESTPVNIECKTTEHKTDCLIDVENYYESKPILNRICFPKKDEEITYDTNVYRAVEIYDPETGETFTKIVHKGDVKTIGDDEYIKLSTVQGGNSQDSSARLINWSFFSVDRLSTWLSDLYVTKWAIVGSLAWSFVL